MNIEIFHDNNLNLEGRGAVRKAVKGVIYHNSKILLIYSEVNKDYKFPGGGVKKDETVDLALKREISEECGLTMLSKESHIGTITEYSRAMEVDKDYFKMESNYYTCKLESFDFKSQNLDLYEAELQFRPKWVSIENAIRINKEVMNTNINVPKWTKRETLFLEYLRDNFYLLK